MTDMDVKRWLAVNGIVDVECLLPDMNGIPRGKVLPAEKIVKAAAGGRLRMASSLFSVAVNGAYTGVGDSGILDPDLDLRIDGASLRRAPGFAHPTAFVFADPIGIDGTLWPCSSRNLLSHVLDRYRARGLVPVVAPEVEFYLVADGEVDAPIVPTGGRSGRAGRFSEPYGIDGLDEFEPLVEEIYADAATASLALDTLIHESGPAQLEINFHHGDALAAADQVILFKRIVRRAAGRHGSCATFMAKPLADHPGSAMHLHVSLIDDGGRNMFVADTGEDSAVFRHFVGGLQRFLPDLTALFAPNVNSLRRLRPRHSAPVNVAWGVDNRSCGLRVPIDGATNRRIENRLPGADANPYLAIAATLVAGLIGIEDAIAPGAQETGNAYLRPHTLPVTPEQALDRLVGCTRAAALLGAPFLDLFVAVKSAEMDDFRGVITPWERDHLLRKV